ncbi:MAG: branched-chain amino acid transaminase [Myxococcales bacterium]|nr:branched-chain amino acid transaminase [Myxococcales bacterium]
MVDKVDKIWMDGKWVDWDQAQVHVLTHTLHYGLGAFEGIRCYKRDDGRSAIFRLKEHIQRLFDSAKIVTIPMPFSTDEIEAACLEAVVINKLEECYLRPLVFVGAGAMGLHAMDNPTHVAVVVWKWGAYLGDDGLEKGIRTKVSSFTRPGINMVLSKGKVVGHYVSSILAKREVMQSGYQEAIMLDSHGAVAEASGENLFLVKQGVVHTPGYGGSLLGGITRDTVITLSQDLGLSVVERQISRDELYVADEVFLCGTAAEVTPVREIDDRVVGEGHRGPITTAIQERFFQVVRGKETLHPEWLSFVERLPK